MRRAGTERLQKVLRCTLRLAPAAPSSQRLFHWQAPLHQLSLPRRWSPRRNLCRLFGLPRHLIAPPERPLAARLRAATTPRRLGLNRATLAPPAAAESRLAGAQSGVPRSTTRATEPRKHGRYQGFSTPHARNRTGVAGVLLLAAIWGALGIRVILVRRPYAFASRAAHGSRASRRDRAASSAACTTLCGVLFSVRPRS